MRQFLFRICQWVSKIYLSTLKTKKVGLGKVASWVFDGSLSNVVSNLGDPLLYVLCDDVTWWHMMTCCLMEHLPRNCNKICLFWTHAGDSKGMQIIQNIPHITYVHYWKFYRNLNHMYSFMNCLPRNPYSS